MIEYAPVSKNKMTYDEAIVYCQFLKYNGYRDWRLPTREDYFLFGNIYGWYLDRERTANSEHPVKPVRDI